MGYQVSGISGIKNYAEALRKYETTKHIRGRAEDQRPLGDRKKIDTFRISKKENGDIQCFLYQTPVVTFTPEDNIVIFLDKWVSSSACKFIWELLWRLGIEARVFDGSICVKFSDGGEYRLQSHTPTTLIRAKHPDGEEDTFTLRDWDKRIVHMVDRKGKKEALAKYSAATEYLYAFVKLRAGEPISEEEVRKAGIDINIANDYTPKTSVFANRMSYIRLWASDATENCHETFYKLAMMLVRHGRLDLEFYENVLLGVNRDRVFKEVQVPDGEVKKDAYKGFYGSNWDSFHAHDDSQNT
jgi:hypothetical protein